MTPDMHSDPPAHLAALNESAARINGECFCPNCSEGRQNAMLADILATGERIEALLRDIKAATRPDSGNGIEILARPGVGQ